jgi:hypothetical protein
MTYFDSCGTAADSSDTRYFDGYKVSVNEIQNMYTVASKS